jgi:hypothetical protein
LLCAFRYLLLFDDVVVIGFGFLAVGSGVIVRVGVPKGNGLERAEVLPPLPPGVVTVVDDKVRDL